jgi:hypothetical protein
MISKFCMCNSEQRCITCRDYVPRKRICPAYRIMLEKAPEIIERLRMENEDLLAQAKFLRAELVEANQMLFRLGYTQSQQARVN